MYVLWSFKLVLVIPCNLIKVQHYLSVPIEMFDLDVKFGG